MARIERDRKVTSPSLPRAYPFVPRRGAGSIVEDVDGNIFLDLNAGIAVTSTGHCHPHGGRGDPAAGGRAAALLGERLLPADLLRGVRAAGRAGAVRRRPPGRSCRTRGPRRSRPRSSSRATPPGRQYLIGFYQSFHGRSMGSVTLTASKAKYRTNFGPMLPSVLPLVLRRLRLHRGGPVQADRLADRGRGDRRGVVARRGRLRPAARGLVPVPARAVRPPRDPARLRRGAVGHGAQRHDVGDRAGGRRRPTSSRPARASRAGCRSAR